MDWLNPASGLVGAIIGAVASYVGTYRAQKAQLAEARQARLDAKQDAAVAALADTLGALLRHARKLPHRYQNSDDAAVSAEEREWDRALRDWTEPVRLAIGVLRDHELRARLSETLNMVEDWEVGLEHAFFRRSRPDLVHSVISHAVECVSAWQRQESLPEPNRDFLAARHSLEYEEEVQQNTRDAEEQIRAEEHAQSDTQDPGPLPSAP